MTTNNTTIAPATDAHPDAAIIAAWEQRAAAYAVYETLAEHTGDGPYSEDELAQWTVIDLAEMLIRNVPAKTVRGAEIQLWCALYHSVGAGAGETGAALRGDLDWFDATGEELDWSDKLVLSAIRSLRAIGGAA